MDSPRLIFDPPPVVSAELAAVLEEFAVTNRHVADWQAYAQTRDVDIADCDEVSGAFVALARDRGLDARVVEAVATGPGLYDRHWFAAVGDVAVDWTAPQFYNVPADEAEWLDPADIPVPLLFTWPGTYPVPYAPFAEVDLGIRYDRTAADHLNVFMIERRFVDLDPDTEVIATQHDIDPTHPAVLAFDPHLSAAAAMPPSLVVMGGELFIDDGHHRIAGAKRARVPIRVELWWDPDECG